MIGWVLRSFRSRESYILLSVFKSLVQPHLDYCCQLWSPSLQHQVNRIENVQKSLISRMNDRGLCGLDYWQKLKFLKLYSQERRRERYMIIFLWKLSQELVSGYTINFSNIYSRTGRKALPGPLSKGPACLRKAKEGSLAVKGASLFNAIPVTLRNSDHGDVAMFKNHLDHYLSNIPDQPSVSGLGRAATSNSLLHQIPLYETSLEWMTSSTLLHFDTVLFSWQFDIAGRHVTWIARLLVFNGSEIW